MDLSQVPLFAALSKRMAWLTERQSVLAQNVANGDTPGYVAQDLPAPDFSKYLANAPSSVALVATVYRANLSMVKTVLGRSG